MSQPRQINLADPRLYGDGEPEVAWSLLRKHYRVYRNTGATTPPFWALTRHADCMEVLRDPSTFVSSLGMRVGAPEASVRAASSKMLIVSDPPRHGAIRKILAPLFAPRAVRERRARVDVIAADVVAAMLSPDGECDFALEVAALPAFTVCDLLGVPAADWQYFSRLTGSAFGEQTEEGKAGDTDKTAAHMEIFDYLDRLAARRRKDRREDLVSLLVGTAIDGRPLSDDEVLLNCEGVINGGIQTTRHAASRGMLGFARAPGEWQELRADPGLLDRAVEEILRWASPPLMVLRHAASPTSIGGQQIEAGDAVVVCNAAANRDPEVFDDPDAFDISRAPGRHLALGIGPHFCIGAALARIELRSLLAALLLRVERVEGAGDPVHLRSNFIWGLSSLPLRLREAR